MEVLYAEPRLEWRSSHSLVAFFLYHMPLRLEVIKRHFQRGSGSLTNPSGTHITQTQRRISWVIKQDSIET